MRILVTGSEGTLGRVLVRELEDRGHLVYCCDVAHGASERHIRCDVGSHRQVDAAFEFARPDLVYHLAAEFGRNNGEDYYEQLWRTNCIGTQNVIDNCIAYGARMVFASSSEVYGESTAYGVDGEPLAEGLLDRNAPAFHNQYALSKYANEKQIFIAAQNRGLRACVLRFFNAYGPGEYYTPYRSVVCLFAYRLMFGLPITVYRNYHRVFQWVGDWARTVANVAERFDALPGCGVPLKAKWYGARPACVPVYNIGGAEYTSVEEMKDKIVALLGGTKSEITVLEKEAANVTNKRPDISRAQADLGHDPRTTLDQGLPPTIKWLYLQYGDIADASLGKWPYRDEDGRTAAPFLKCQSAISTFLPERA